MPQPDPLGKYFAGSLGLHAAIVGVVVLSGMWKFSKKTWGAEHASTGSVGVTMVNSIPIPRRDAPENPLANDSDSERSAGSGAGEDRAPGEGAGTEGYSDSG